MVRNMGLRLSRCAGVLDRFSAIQLKHQDLAEELEEMSSVGSGWRWYGTSGGFGGGPAMASAD